VGVLIVVFTFVYTSHGEGATMVRQLLVVVRLGNAPSCESLSTGKWADGRTSVG